jgi:hypothetical protein
MQFERGIIKHKKQLFLLNIGNIVSKLLHQKLNRTSFAVLGVNSRYEIIAKISNQICYSSFDSKLHQTQSSSHSHYWLNTRHITLEQVVVWRDHYKYASKN